MSELRNDIRRYLNGEMTPAEMHDLEKRALYDPFLADALEGAENIDPKTFIQDVEGFEHTFNRRRSIFTPLRIAASVLVLVAAGFAVYQFSASQKEEVLSLNNKDQTAQTLGDSSLEESGNPISPQPESKAEEERKEDNKKNKAATEASPKVDQQQLIAEAKPKEKQIDETQPTAGAKTEEAPVEAESLREDIAVADDRSAEVEKTDLILQTADESKKSKKSAGESLARARVAMAAAPVQTVTGTVTSTEDGSGLPGVNVIIKGTTTGTVTDAQGNYSIETSSSSPTLVFSSIGLVTQEMQADATKAANDVQLAGDTAELSEVVVTGYAARDSKDLSESPIVYPTLQLTKPVSGKDAFQEYLKSNLKYPSQAITNKIQGRVTVQFTVTSQGLLTDFTVVKGIGSGCDDELIRLIKEGPAWTPTTRNGTPVDDKVKVRFKFELP